MSFSYIFLSKRYTRIIIQIKNNVRKTGLKNFSSPVFSMPTNHFYSPNTIENQCKQRVPVAAIRED